MTTAIGHPKPYRLLLKGEAQPIALTVKKWEGIHDWYHNGKATEVYDLHNDEGHYFATISKSDVVRLYSIVKKDRGLSHVQYYCGYGELHGEGEDCTCADMYAGMPYHIMHKTLRKAGYELVLDGMLDNQFKNCTQEMKDYMKKGIAETGYKYVPASREELMSKFNILKNF